MVGKVRANLSDESYEAIQRFCAEQGITMTALFEAFGQAIHRGEYEPGGKALEVLADARRITAERLSRRR